MKKRLVLLLALLAVLQGCVKGIYLDAGEKPKVVVECVLTEDPVQELYLSYTKGVSQKEADQLLEAEARLIDLETDEYSDLFSYDGGGKWTLDYSAIPSHTYRLEVKIPHYDLIMAETTMPEVPGVWCNNHMSGYYSSLEFNEEGKKRYGNSGGTLYHNIPNHCWIYFINDDGSIAETICTDYSGVDNFNVTGGNYVPPARKMTVGVFEVGSTLYPALKDKALHNQYLRITEGDSFPLDTKVYTDAIAFFSHSFMIAGSFDTQEKTARLYFEVLSEEYDLYLASAMRDSYLDSTDISKIYLRDNILGTNIQGGLGIFGAKTSKILEWRNTYSITDNPLSL